MPKINIYFEDLNEQAQKELYEEVKEYLKEEIEEAIEANALTDPDLIEWEIVMDYIKEHNFANEFIV